jgi:glycosyltransferase involved in cell wall biosynthesis
MVRLGIIGLINFGDWDNHDYAQTGGINSVVKNVLPFLKADKIVLFGFTSQRDRLYQEVSVNRIISVVPVVYVPMDTFLPIRLFGFIQGWRLRLHLKRNKIDLVYSHSEELCFWLTFGRSYRYIHHLHTYVNVLAVSSRASAKSRVLQKFWQEMRARVIKKSHKIVAVNKDVFALCEQLIGEQRIIEFPNYVDEKIFTFKESGRVKENIGPNGCMIALFLGRISQVKGLELFVDTVLELNKLDSVRWVGVMVGTGEYDGAVRNYIANRGGETTFILTGSINRQSEIVGYYSAANVFLITSLSESVPLTLLESLSCGTPVVSSDVGVASEVLGKNNGFVIASRDPRLFAEAALACVPFKSKSSLLHNGYRYSVQRASDLLNKEFELLKT